MLAVSAMSNLYAENDSKAKKKKKENWKSEREEITYSKRDRGPGFQSHQVILTLTRANRC